MYEYSVIRILYNICEVTVIRPITVYSTILCMETLYKQLLMQSTQNQNVSNEFYDVLT